MDYNIMPPPPPSSNSTSVAAGLSGVMAPPVSAAVDNSSSYGNVPYSDSSQNQHGGSSQYTSRYKVG